MNLIQQKDTPEQTPPQINNLTIKKWLSILTYVGIIIFGVYGLVFQLTQIFFKYPDMFQTMLNSHNTSLYILLLQQVLFISLSNFITSAYGLAMLIKPSKTVKVFNLVIIIFLVSISYYFNSNYQLTPEIISQIQSYNPGKDTGPNFIEYRIGLKEELNTTKDTFKKDTKENFLTNIYLALRQFSPSAQR